MNTHQYVGERLYFLNTGDIPFPADLLKPETGVLIPPQAVHSSGKSVPQCLSAITNQFSLSK